MKSITLNDVLKLPIMKGYRLAAGKNGLNNFIHNVTVYDNFPSNVDETIAIFDNDIYLTFFYYGKDDPAFVLEVLKKMQKLNAAAIIILDEYINTLAADAQAFCDTAGLPVIFLDARAPYSLIISQIMELSLSNQQQNKIQNKISTLLNPSALQNEKISILNELNPHFKNKITVLYCIDNGGDKKQYRILMNQLNRNLLHYCCEYRDGLVIILSYEEYVSFNYSSYMENILSRITEIMPTLRTGVSNPCLLTDCGQALSQAITALRSNTTGSQIFYYQNLGVIRILSAMLGKSELEEFYNDMTNPVIQFDRQYSGQLLETMTVFLDCDRDYKRTSAAMFVHDNTIRYRINKIKELIPYGISDNDFYETISVIYKIYKLKQLFRENSDKAAYE